MKPPYRNLIGIAVGAVLGLLLPQFDGVLSAVGTIGELALILGRYFLLPLIFFSLAIAVTKLRRLKSLGSLLYRSALYAVIASAALALAGTLLAWAMRFGRIPVVPGNIPEIETAGLTEILRNILGFENFQNPRQEGITLLPLIIPAFILGWHFYHDREIAEPSFNLFDSLSRILYRANRYLLILMPGFLAVFAFSAVYSGRRVVDFGRFVPLLGILLGAALVLIVGIYPFLLWVLGDRRSPWRSLGGLSGALLGAFVSGSPMFNYGNLIFHLKENLKIPRHSSALVTPIYMIFARGGTAFVSAVCMMMVIRSYSSLEITLFQAAWTALFAFLVSFAVPTLPDRGLAAAMVMLGSIYGRGSSDGWLILAPILPLLIMLAALIDTATGAVLIIIATRRAGVTAGKD